MTIEYVVHWGDWLPDYPNEDDDEGGRQWNESDKIDDRTERSKFFETLDDAKVFARAKLKERADDKWLAYIEVKKVIVELIEKVK